MTPGLGTREHKLVKTLTFFYTKYIKDRFSRDFIYGKRLYGHLSTTAITGTPNNPYMNISARGIKMAEILRVF